MQVTGSVDLHLELAVVLPDLNLTYQHLLHFSQITSPTGSRNYYSPLSVASQRGSTSLQTALPLRSFLLCMHTSPCAGTLKSHSKKKKTKSCTISKIPYTDAEKRPRDHRLIQMSELFEGTPPNPGSWCAVNTVSTLLDQRIYFTWLALHTL